MTSPVNKIILVKADPNIWQGASYDNETLSSNEYVRRVKVTMYTDMTNTAKVESARRGKREWNENPASLRSNKIYRNFEDEGEVTTVYVNSDGELIYSVVLDSGEVITMNSEWVRVLPAESCSIR